MRSNVMLSRGNGSVFYWQYGYRYAAVAARELRAAHTAPRIALSGLPFWRSGRPAREHLIDADRAGVERRRLAQPDGGAADPAADHPGVAARRPRTAASRGLDLAQPVAESRGGHRTALYARRGSAAGAETAETDQAERGRPRRAAGGEA